MVWYGFRLFAAQSMSLFFKEGSQVSEYQNTAFFQNGEASKASIFDNPPQSESQLAFELFNRDSPPNRDHREKSLISQLELLERSQEFTQTPLPADPRKMSKRDGYIESQESKDSRMTFGAKMQNKLRQSKAEEPPKFYEERKEPSKPKPLAARPKPNQPSSNFSLHRQGGLPAKEPDSMPVKFDDFKPIAKAAFEAPSNSSSSSFSIDFEELRQRNQQMEVKPIAKLASLRFGNEKEPREGRSESGKSEKLSDYCSTDSRFEDKEKEKKFGFNLRRSRVAEEAKDCKPQNSLSLKPSPSAAVVSAAPAPQFRLDAKTVKNQEKAAVDEAAVTPFKLKLNKQPSKELIMEKTLVSSNVKKVDADRPSLFSRIPQEQKLGLDAEKPVQIKTLEKDTRKIIDNKAKQERELQEVSFEQDSLVRSDDNQPSKKRQSIGLKEQLKKLTSRPTEKVELKSIAFNKSFKLKPTKSPEEKPQSKPEEKNFSKENGSGLAFTLQKSIEPEMKTSTKSFMNLKQDRCDNLPSKPTKNTEFGKYMLMLMELQQECEALKSRTLLSRNCYRELAILNDDINRRIDALKEPKR